MPTSSDTPTGASALQEMQTHLIELVPLANGEPLPPILKVMTARTDITGAAVAIRVAHFNLPDGRHGGSIIEASWLDGEVRIVEAIKHPYANGAYINHLQVGEFTDLHLDAAENPGLPDVEQP